METLGFNCWRGNARRMAGAHRHLEIEANLVLRGALVYQFGGARVEVNAGELAVFWGSVPHQLIFSDENSEVSWLTLPLAQFLSWELPQTLTQAVLNGALAKESADLERDVALFAAWESDLGSRQTERARIAALEVEARLRRLALNHSAVEARAKSTQGELRHVEKMAAFMAQDYASSLSIEAIASAAGVHPNYAMNLFKREFGLSLGEFLTRTRLSHAQRLLATTDRKVLDIAMGCGFGSASRFYAAFKAHCGQSPTSYRRGLISGSGSARGDGAGG